MRAQAIAPTIYNRIPPWIRATMMVAPAIEDGSWALEIGPNLGVEELHEFQELWTKVSTWEPQIDVPDTIAWAWEPNGHYSVRSAYATKFWGRTVDPMEKLA